MEPCPQNLSGPVCMACWCKRPCLCYLLWLGIGTSQLQCPGFAVRCGAALSSQPQSAKGCFWMMQEDATQCNAPCAWDLPCGHTCKKRCGQCLQQTLEAKGVTKAGTHHVACTTSVALAHTEELSLHARLRLDTSLNT